MRAPTAGTAPRGDLPMVDATLATPATALPSAVNESPRRPLARAGAVARHNTLPFAALAFLAAGAVAWAVDRDGGWSSRIWLAGLVATGLPVVWSTVRGMLAGRFAADVVAALAIIAAVPLAQPLAGLVVVLMQTGGEALDRLAARRASRAVRALEEAAPRLAHRVVDGRTEDVAADAVAVGDIVLVRPGDLVPCDGVVMEGRSHVDASRLTGEPLPVSAEPGARLMSGSMNLDGALTVRVTAISRESQYARIVELVRSAQASKAPLQRLADRYAVWFTPLTILVCVVAYAVTGDPLRILSVLVVATPCPLILATPVAVIGGINRAARRQIIVRHGGALEQLGTVRTAVFDKTGTITIGQPHVHRVVNAPWIPREELLRTAAALEVKSGHLLARTVVEAAEVAGLALPAATNAREMPGRGITGVVDGREVIVGARSLVRERCPHTDAAFEALEQEHGGLRAYVAIDGRAAGIIEYADAIRPGLDDFLGELRRLGISRTVLLSGDHEPNARAVAAAVHIQEVAGDLLPEDKVAAVRRMTAAGERVAMVGDGINDAPALSAATVGIALAGHGGGITAEAADVVILVDDLGRVAEAIRISRRTMRIARQGIWVGLGLSALAMLFAAHGLIVPTAGALLQEAIDLAVIVNALRTSR
ncbi:MAG TPA: heavy metal translocating P-type ATPase [Gemmatimonadaceae bacterium]|nr:heavy metal translocating P-type ATPase [Gemmatimonadaceae bacterium]